VFDHIIMDPVSILPIEASCMIESILLAEGLDFCCRAASGSSCYRNERSYRSCNSKNSSRLCLVLDITVQKAYSFSYYPMSSVYGANGHGLINLDCYLLHYS
jgi:hypothetical protein